MRKPLRDSAGSAERHHPWPSWAGQTSTATAGAASGDSQRARPPSTETATRAPGVQTVGPGAGRVRGEQHVEPVQPDLDEGGRAGERAADDRTDEAAIGSRPLAAQRSPRHPRAGPAASPPAPARTAPRPTSAPSRRRPRPDRCRSRWPAARSCVPTKRATNALAGRPVDLGRRAQLLEPPARHHADPVRDAERLLLVVGDEQGGDAQLGLDAADLVPQEQRAPWRPAPTAARRAAARVGEPASARARATRCCCPPESWCG